jgi:hypothetical protein
VYMRACRTPRTPSAEAYAIVPETRRGGHPGQLEGGKFVIGDKTATGSRSCSTDTMRSAVRADAAVLPQRVQLLPLLLLSRRVKHRAERVRMHSIAAGSY